MGLVPCPLLPPPRPEMSFRDLQPPVATTPKAFFLNACSYSNYLWTRAFPARAILALCRAVYLDPRGLGPDIAQPYAAYVWLLSHYSGRGFLGNPRVSFSRQATRVPRDQKLKINRAWAMWYLSISTELEFDPDPEVKESPPDRDQLIRYLNEEGLPGEGETLSNALEMS